MWQKLSSFQPTVILTASIHGEYNEKLHSEYKKYLAHPEMIFENPTEVELLAYELGRISGVKRIYGIDHRMGYNYNKTGSEIENEIDSIWYDKYYRDPFSFYPKINVNEDSLDLLV